MNVFETIAALGAELVSNRAVVRTADGDRVVVAQVVGDEMVLTAEGEVMAADVKPAPAPKAKTTAKSKTTKAAATPTTEE